MTQTYYEQIEPAVIDMELKVQSGCICTLTRGDLMEYKKDHSADKKKTKYGYILSTVYPSGAACLLDQPEWEGWTVGERESERVAAIGGRLAWL